MKLIKNIFKYLLPILYIILSFFICLFLEQQFILDKCHLISGGLGYSGRICGGNYSIYEKVAFPLYLLFLLLSIYVYIRNTKFKDSRNFLWITYTVLFVLLFYIVFVSLITPTGFEEGLPMRPLK